MNIPNLKMPNPDDTVTLTVSELLKLMHRKFCEGVVYAYVKGDSPGEPHPAKDPQARQDWIQYQLEHLEGTLKRVRSGDIPPILN